MGPFKNLCQSGKIKNTGKSFTPLISLNQFIASLEH